MKRWLAHSLCQGLMSRPRKRAWPAPDFSYPRSFSQNRAGFVAGILISGILVIYLASFVSIDDFLDVAGDVPVWTFVVALVVYVALNLFRAIRFRLLTEEKRPALVPMLAVTLYHNFLLRTMPFQTGEFSYIYLSRRYLGWRASKGVSSLLLVRLFDLLFVLAGAAAGLIIAGTDSLDQPTAVGALLIGLLAVVACAIYFSDRLTEVPIRLAGWSITLGRWRDSQKLILLQEKLEEIPPQLNSFRAKAVLTRTLITSSLIYGASLSFGLVLLSGTGLDIGVGTMILVISMVMIASWFPVSFGGFGIIEGGWAVGLHVLADVDPSVGVAVGFFMHGSQVLASALTGMLRFALLTRLGGSGNSNEASPTG